MQTNLKIVPRLLIIDIIMREGNEPFICKFTDVQMVALTQGRVRTEKEFRKLLDHCGFDIVWSSLWVSKNNPINELIEQER